MYENFEFRASVPFFLLEEEIDLLLEALETLGEA